MSKTKLKINLGQWTNNYKIFWVRIYFSTLIYKKKRCFLIITYINKLIYWQFFDNNIKTEKKIKILNRVSTTFKCLIKLSTTAGIFDVYIFTCIWHTLLIKINQNRKLSRILIIMNAIYRFIAIVPKNAHVHYIIIISWKQTFWSILRGYTFLIKITIIILTPHLHSISTDNAFFLIINFLFFFLLLKEKRLIPMNFIKFLWKYD